MPLVLFDTNIFIDAMLGHQAAEQVLSGYPNCAISFVTYIEVMAGAKKSSEILRARAMLAPLKSIQSTPEIMRRAAGIRHGSVAGMK